MPRLDVTRVCTVVKKRGEKRKGKGRNYTTWVAMKSAELKIKLCVCVLAQQHVWEGVQHTVLPNMRLGSRRTSVFRLPTLSGHRQGDTDDISNQEEEEGSVMGWASKVAFGYAESTMD